MKPCHRRPPHRLPVILALACAAAAAGSALLAGPTEDALKIGEDALAKGDAASATTTWVNAYNERALEKTATDETCAKLLWNAGSVFGQTGGLAAAVDCFEKLHPLRIALSGATHPETGKVASTLAAAIANNGGDLDRAEALAREAVEILETAAEAHRSDHFTALSNLAGVLLAKKDRLAASQIFNAALKLANQHPGAGIPPAQIAACHDSLAQIAGFFGRTTDKLNHLRLSLDLKRKALGKHHVQVFMAWLELAATLSGDEAVESYDAMIAALYEATGSESDAKLQQAWAVAEYKLAILESQRGNQDRVVSLLESAIKHGTKGYGELHPELLQLNLDLAKLYLTRKNYDRGVACYRQVLAIRRKHLGPEHESTLETQKMLDGLLADLARIKGG